MFIDWITFAKWIKMPASTHYWIASLWIFEMCFLSVLYSATTENNFEENNFAIDYKNGESVFTSESFRKNRLPVFKLVAMELGIFF